MRFALPTLLFCAGLAGAGGALLAEGEEARRGRPVDEVDVAGGFVQYRLKAVEGVVGLAAGEGLAEIVGVETIPLDGERARAGGARHQVGDRGAVRRRTSSPGRAMRWLTRPPPSGTDTPPWVNGRR